MPFSTRLRALLAVDSPAALMEALTFSETCLHNAESTHNTLQVIRIGVRQALILHRLGYTEAAHDALGQTLTLAEPGGFLRTFLDRGAPMAELLREFVVTRCASTYLNTLLAAFAQELGTDPPPDLAAEYAQRYGITPLTPLELEVLTLVSQHLTQAEIAKALVISISTVKNHTHNIYSKLGVRSGRQAVAKARDVGILTPS